MNGTGNGTNARTRVVDGGLGSELDRRGLNVSDALWSARALLEQPQAIEQAHYDYLHAGAEVIIAASYQVSFEGFAQAGLSAADAERALLESVAIARRARERYAHEAGGAGQVIQVAASVGPYGAVRADGSEFHGNYGVSFDALVEFHRARLEVLARAGADLLACETLPSLEEARAIVAAMRQFPVLRAWFAFTCADERHTCHGEPMRECARVLDAEPAAVAVGVNCTAPHLVTPLIAEARAGTQKPIVVYPNRGQKWDAARRRWTGPAAPQDWGTLAQQWYAAGANWIGGCCGTTPDDIAQVRAALRVALPSCPVSKPRWGPPDP